MSRDINQPGDRKDKREISLFHQKTTAGSTELFLVIVFMRGGGSYQSHYGLALSAYAQDPERKNNSERITGSADRIA